MPASIRVESGISAGTSYWVDRPVLRIGSDPQCEICLPSAELAPHALTLEFRAGQYRAYNRGTTPIRVGATALAPGANGIWAEDHALHLPGDLRLVLDVDGDPQPSPPPETRADDGYAIDDGATLAGVATSSPAAPTAKMSSGTLLQLGVIGGCILAMVALLTMGRGSEENAPPRITFEAVVTKLLAQEDEGSRALVDRLRYAEAALVRGNRGLARQRFTNLRDRLMRQEDATPSENHKQEQLLRQFVEYRMGQLQ